MTETPDAKSQATAEPAALPRPGERLLDKYEVEAVIGMGAMGVVMSARHIELNRRVAIKILKPESSRRPIVVERFLREAQVALSIQSAHVIRVMDVGKLANGLPFMVMEYLEGEDLSDHVTSVGPLSPATAINYVLQACDALSEAHQRGVVHRDLKPSNLFLTTRIDGSPLVKLLDFGVAKTPIVAGEDGMPAELSLTETAMMLGSPAYMAPEQVRSAKHVDARADIWAVGIIFYKLLGKVAPFEGETFSSLCAAIVADEPKSLCEINPEVPPELEQVVLKCLEKDPTARWPSIESLAKALRQLQSPVASARQEATTLAPPAAEPAEVLTTTRSGGSGATPRVVAIALVASIAIGTSLYIAFRTPTNNGGLSTTPSTSAPSSAAAGPTSSPVSSTFSSTPASASSVSVMPTSLPSSLPSALPSVSATSLPKAPVSPIPSPRTSAPAASSPTPAIAPSASATKSRPIDDPT